MIIYDGNNNRVAETDYAYDPTGVAGTLNTTGHDYGNYSSGYNNRGNATTGTRKCFPSCADAATIYTYDDTGQVLSMKDPNGNTTTYSCVDSFTSGGTPPGPTNAYISRITRPRTGGVDHVESLSYDYTNGKPTVTRDENQQPTAYTYADAMGRRVWCWGKQGPSLASL